MCQGYQSLCIRKRCFMWVSDKSRAMLLSCIFSQQFLVKIIKWWICLCDNDVLNDIIILN